VGFQACVEFRGEQDVGEQEWAEVVDGEGPLVAVVGGASPTGHGAGVVDQDVELVVTVGVGGGVGPHSVER
jgi:hypothetical protein